MSGKRQNTFGQGRPERPYEERDSGPEDVPTRATAAQLATRKIKSVKARRPAGTSPNLSQSANFGAPQPSGFNFGASAPAPASNNNANAGANNAGAFNFGASNAFGGAATNSFPPAQPAAPTNSFANSSFPAFGGSGQGTGLGFDPTPSSAAGGFSFTAGPSAGASNPFAASAAPMMNGSGAVPAFGGGMFSQSQPAGNPFGGLSQNNTTSSGSSGGMFGTAGGASQPSMFGGITSSAPAITSTPAPASQPFTFGAASSSAQNTASTPATSSMFGFGASTQTSAAPVQNSLFSGFGADVQKSEGATATPQKMTFGGFGASTQPAETATPAAPSAGLFTFGTPAQKSESATTAAPPPTFFGSISSAAQTASTPAPAAAANPFANLQPAATPASTPFQFGSTQQTPQASATPNGLFSSIKPADQNSIATPEAPKPNLFASLGAPISNPAATPLASSSGFNFFAASQNQDKPSETAEKAPDATFKAFEAPKANIFGGFSTPQPKKAADSEKPQAGLFTAQPKASTGMFSQPFQPESHNSANLFNTQPSSSLFMPQSTTPTEEPTEATVQQSATKEASNPFASLPTASGDRQNFFNTPKEQAPAPPAATMPALTGTSASSTAAAPELPKIPKAQVPKDWAVPSVEPSQKGSVLYKIVVDLSSQLRALNLQYRDRMNTIDMGADLSALSLWHHQTSTTIKRKIDVAKKQRASANGVTGYESALSTKRKVNDGSPESRDPSSKRARGGVTPSSPTPQPSASTPRLNPPATTTSNLFARAIDNKSSTAESSSLATPKTPQKSAPEPAKAAAPEPAKAVAPEPVKAAAPATGFTPSFPATNGTSAASSSGGFKPSGFTPSTSSAPGGFKPSGFTPSFGSSSAGGGGSFLGQFAKTAKTYEELAAERKKKEFDEDYDSDDETKAEWNARWDAKEAKRLEEEKAKMAAAPGFSVPAAKVASNATPAAKPPASNPFAMPASNPFAGLAKSTSSAPTAQLFGSRTGSPAPSTSSGLSVFNAPSAVKAPSANIFGHLSSGPSSINGADESDEDDEEQGTGKSQPDQLVGSVEPTTPRTFGESETESEETGKQQPAGTKNSLLSRMSKGGEVEAGSEKENESSPPLFGQANGTQTPTNKPFTFFDFGAAGSKTAPPKSDTFAGDQTFKMGTPIKFGDVAATEKKAAPTFSFSSTTSTTPSKPPPASLFSFGSAGTGSSLLAPNAAQSGPSSVFSSRAATPLSEADTNAASATDDDEEGGKQEQVDLSELTEEEKSSNDIVFFSESALVKQLVDRGEGKEWENIAKGRLWILKDKTTGKSLIRLRIASGATRLNYQILPALRTMLTGSSKKMVKATKPGDEGGLTQVCFMLKSPEVAQEFSTKYDESIPSS
ncbi:hypothetical protein P153DRAFT_342795 [Dothidotthia symphoricarpi CBS 119687]|uniref:RanBD1 domain-containing protein n=1 Tax=Dothidotthia symphoricarpi CBS 119687 TaxID=1392245 RepID=A0A6A6A9M4_9PLEO|nr:uncharacterized protein P153DRAFT_342795 [Dothidotthia symphoricarpi CBS 119687]KAF2127875.1 hypothetical protein P153DRAFT_342795 [Dothidotthia symphoricarpi CBS 119687]